MTTPTSPTPSSTVTLSLSFRDADAYLHTRRPALPVVKEAIRTAMNNITAMANRCEVTITRDDAERFVRKSTRPMRLPSGQTLKSLIQLALDAADVIPDTSESRAAAAAAESEPTNADVFGDEPEPVATEPMEPWPSSFDGDEPEPIAVTEPPSPLGDDGVPVLSTNEAEFNDVIESALDVHSTEPDQEPSPVAQEGHSE